MQTSTPHLSDWEAKRSGPAQTVTGQCDGKRVKVGAVRTIKRVQSGTVRRTVALNMLGVVLAYLED